MGTISWHPDQAFEINRMRRELKIAVGAYDRTLPLMAGLIEIEAVDARFITAPLEEFVARAFDECAYDVTELSASNDIYLTARWQQGLAPRQLKIE